MKLGQKMLGKKLFGEIMKRTFYGQFVAGPVFSYNCINANFKAKILRNVFNSAKRLKRKSFECNGVCPPPKTNQKLFILKKRTH